MKQALVLALCALALPAGAATLPLSRAFQDWIVECDNGGRCVAIGLQEQRTPTLVARIERDAGPDGGLRASLLGAARAGDGRLLLDGRPFVLDRERWRWRPHGGDMPGARWDTDDPEAVRALVDMIRNGTTLAPAEAAADGDGLSLRGLSAALLLVDDVQRRLDTRGALLRRGTRPDAGVPPPPALPVLRGPPAVAPLAAADATGLAAAVRRARASLLDDMDCDPEERDGDAAFALTTDDALVLLSCMTGAYQVGSLPFRTPRQAPQRARLLELPSLPGEQPPEMLWSAGYAADRGVLFHHVKGRGLGDCGEAANWLFDGSAFHLLEMRHMPRCGGLLPGDWPGLWRATVAP